MVTPEKQSATFADFDWASDYNLLPGTILKFTVGERMSLFTCTGLVGGHTTTGILEQFDVGDYYFSVPEARIRLEHPLSFFAEAHRPYVEFLFSQEDSETRVILPNCDAQIAYLEELGQSILAAAADQPPS